MQLFSKRLYSCKALNRDHVDVFTHPLCGLVYCTWRESMQIALRGEHGDPNRTQYVLLTVFLNIFHRLLTPTYFSDTIHTGWSKKEKKTILQIYICIDIYKSILTMDRPSWNTSASFMFFVACVAPLTLTYVIIPLLYSWLAKQYLVDLLQTLTSVTSLIYNTPKRPLLSFVKCFLAYV